jgi:hypothetical protein
MMVTTKVTLFWHVTPHWVEQSHPTSLLFCRTVNKYTAYTTYRFYVVITPSWGTRWRILLRYCATSRKVAVSIADSVNGIFH